MRYKKGVLISVENRDIDKKGIFHCSRSVKKIGEFAFEGCDRLKEINLPDGLEVIGEFAFKDCTSLTSITLPESVQILGAAIFVGCKNLKEIYLPEGIEIIGKFAFGRCTSLTSITIPKSVKVIEDSIFVGCENLKEINLSEEFKEDLKLKESLERKEIKVNYLTDEELFKITKQEDKGIEEQTNQNNEIMKRDIKKEKCIDKKPLTEIKNNIVNQEKE